MKWKRREGSKKNVRGREKKKKKEEGRKEEEGEVEKM